MKRFAAEFIDMNWNDPSELHGCGKFAADSWKVFCLRQWKRCLRDPGLNSAVMAYARHWQRHAEGSAAVLTPPSKVGKGGGAAPATTAANATRRPKKAKRPRTPVEKVLTRAVHTRAAKKEAKMNASIAEAEVAGLPAGEEPPAEKKRKRGGSGGSGSGSGSAEDEGQEKRPARAFSRVVDGVHGRHHDGRNAKGTPLRRLPRVCAL
ncbi:unnamed protein product [Phaeothamnion confervicola]